MVYCLFGCMWFPLYEPFFGPMGTVASGLYLEDVVLQDPAFDDVSWMIVRWVDSNDNNLVDSPLSGDTFDVLVSGDQYWDGT